MGASPLRSISPRSGILLVLTIDLRKRINSIGFLPTTTARFGRILLCKQRMNGSMNHGKEAVCPGRDRWSGPDVLRGDRHTISTEQQLGGLLRHEPQADGVCQH